MIMVCAVAFLTAHYKHVLCIINKIKIENTLFYCNSITKNK